MSIINGNRIMLFLSFFYTLRIFLTLEQTHHDRQRFIKLYSRETHTHRRNRRGHSKSRENIFQFVVREKRHHRRAEFIFIKQVGMQICISYTHVCFRRVIVVGSVEKIKTTTTYVQFTKHYNTYLELLCRVAWPHSVLYVSRCVFRNSNLLQFATTVCTLHMRELVIRICLLFNRARADISRI